MPGLEELVPSWGKGIQTSLHSGPAQASRMVCAEAQHGCLQRGDLDVHFEEKFREPKFPLTAGLEHSRKPKLYLRCWLLHFNKPLD